MSDWRASYTEPAETCGAADMAELWVYPKMSVVVPPDAERALKVLRDQLDKAGLRAMFELIRAAEKAAHK